MVESHAGSPIQSRHQQSAHSVVQAVALFAEPATKFITSFGRLR